MSDGRKILFVGDLRTAYNYGAIATTESLLDLMQKVSPKSEIKLIDSRSFSGDTPEDGWPDINYKEELKKGLSLQKKIVLLTKKLYVYPILKKVKNRVCRVSYKYDNIPARYDLYERTSENIKKGALWKFEKKCIEWSDVVIINSEGNIVNGTDKQGYYRNGGRYVLFIAYLAKVALNKRCYIINHTVDPKNRDIKKIITEIYPMMDGIYVREKMSYNLLESWGIKNTRYVPDALWTHDFSIDAEVNIPTVLKDIDFSKPYICIGDSSGIYNKYSQIKWNVVEVYTKLICELKEIYSQIIFIDGYSGENENIETVVKKNNLHSVHLRNCSYHELYFILSHAKLFISGRWHASIISLLGHTPILLWGADSHKTEALYEEIDYKYEFFDVATLPLNIDRLVEEARKIINDSHNDVWDKVDELKNSAIKNVDMLTFES